MNIETHQLPAEDVNCKKMQQWERRLQIKTKADTGRETRDGLNASCVTGLALRPARAANTPFDFLGRSCYSRSD
jgi:hypothetical protein